MVINTSFQNHHLNGTNIRYRHMKMATNEPQDVKVKEEHYIPSWRAACDAWVTENVEDHSGVHTPVYLLYNAYISDNPDNYMDIGQFGKVLRSRFPYRKRRRGKQGQQVYVYQDVALKPKKNVDTQEQLLSDPTTLIHKFDNISVVSPVAGLTTEVGSDIVGQLSSLPQLGEEEATDGTASSVKRKHLEHIVKSASPKKLKTIADSQTEDSSTSGDEKYSNATYCRMAIGRKWIDNYLIETPGQHTYANDICQAYDEDHPHESLAFTSLALLIRGKYPGRRRKLKVGHETTYIFQNLSLKRDHTKGAISIKSETHSGTSSPSSQGVVCDPSSKSTEPSKPTQQFESSPAVANITSSTSTAATSNVSLKNLAAHPTLNPVLIQLPTNNTQFRMVNMPTITGSVSIPYVVSSRSYSPTNYISLPNNIPNPDEILRERKSPSPTNQTFNDKEDPPTGKVMSPSIRNTAHQTEHYGPRRSNCSEDIPGLTTSSKDMDVGDYLESELLDIDVNDLRKKPIDSTISIKMPPLDIVSNSGVGPSTLPKPENYKNYHKKFGNINLSGASSPASTGHGVLGHNNPRIPVSVMEMSNKEIIKPKKTWDYEIRKSVSPELLANFTENYEAQSRKLKIKKNKNKKNVKPVKSSPQNTLEDGASNFSDNTKEVIYSSLNMPMAELFLSDSSGDRVSNSSKCSGGSPTSSTPPGAAMNRMAEEIDTSTPQIGKPLYQVMASPYSSTPNHETREDRSQLDRTYTLCSAEWKPVTESYTSRPQLGEPFHQAQAHPPIRRDSGRPCITDPLLKNIIKYIVTTAKKLRDKTREPVTENMLVNNMEAAILGENYAVSYKGSFDSECFPCLPTDGLRNLESLSPEEAIELIRHHQSCSGIGCTKECQTLRAAYIHIALFHHKCSVWESFYNIIAKHSSQCRIMSCGVEFCHFVKHELHLNGASVLPIQLLKERYIVEKEFKKCESFGAHTGDLHCRHSIEPKLPTSHVASSPKSPPKASCDNQVTASNRNSFTLPISWAFPDTAAGNAIVVQTTKTINLVMELFQEVADVT